MSDLFSAAERLERIPMLDAEVYYLSDLALGRERDEILQRLIADTDWRQDSIVVWGKTYQQPRLVAWHGDRGIDYTYSGIRLSPMPWTELLLDIKRKVESVTQDSFNSVLLNYYRDNRDSMGFHSDDEPELGEKPVIASVSLGKSGRWC